MKLQKSHAIFSIILIYSVVVFFLPTFAPTSILNPQNGVLGLILNLILYLGLFIWGLFTKLQEHSLNSKEITFIAVYSAFSAVARIPFVAIPGLQPCSFLIFCAGYTFGPMIGFLVGQILRGFQISF